MHSLLHARQSLSAHKLTPKVTRVTLSGPRRLAMVLASATLLAGCATTSPFDSTETEVNDVIVEQSQQPDGEASAYEDEPIIVATDVEAENAARRTSQAEYYQRQALNQEDTNARVDATLSSAEYFVQANEHQRAAELVLSIRDLIATQEQQNRAIIVLAYADYAEGNYQRALLNLETILPQGELPQDEQPQRALTDQELLDQEASELQGSALTDHEGQETSASSNDDLSASNATDEQNTELADQEGAQRTYIDASKEIIAPEALTTQQVDALLLSSFCHQALGQYEPAISTLILRESALYGASRAETTRYIWQVINTIPLEQREFIAAQSQNTQVHNRVQQSLIGEIGGATQSPQQFAQWREDTPVVASPETALDSTWHINSPRSVYVLLPLSSRFGKAAQAVKAGIDREHELNDSPYRPTLNYYDIGDNPLQIGQYYAAAVRAGADFIIGPIGRTFSNEANSSSGYFSNNRYGNANTTMLMLGGDQPLNNGNLRLTMSPEAEGQRIAERAWQDGHLSAGVLLSNSSNSQRVLNGFNQRWLSLGGKLSKTVEYSSTQFDHSAQLKQLFGIHLSEYRHRQLSQALGFKPKFSPYQRGDIDFVFMIADDKAGRIVRPQINFFTNSQLPVYATSAIYNGIEDTINNMDLDDTRFPVMPWVARSGKVSPYAGQLNMLHAMGMDAYRVAGGVQELRQSTSTAIIGNTGQLQLNTVGEIIYRPAWAQFKQGELDLVDTNGLELTPIEAPSPDDDSSGLLDSTIDGAGSSSNNSRGSYNDQNWDSRESRRKTGG